MPHLCIKTNLPRSKIPDDFPIKATSILAKTLGKPESYCAVSVIPDLPMAFAGSTDPCAMAEVMSIGSLGVDLNKKHSAVIGELVQKELGVPNDRMYIEFKNEDKSNVGFHGTTFHDLL